MKESIGEKIAVCLLTYNHVDIVESTIRTILNQTITGYEVIVSDNCSTDGTWERINMLAAEDVRIRPVRTHHNIGMAGNANFAVTQTDRPYIALLHHDNLYRDDLLEKWALVLERNPSAAFVFNPYGIYESDFVSQEPMPGECIDGKWLLNHYLFARWGCVVAGMAMIRLSAWERVGGMREQFDLLADIDLWMRLAMRWDVGYVSEPVITLRQQRPSYYPDIYTGNEWHWERQCYLYKR
jgi:GT2 family glycosyltransferase